MRNLIFALGLVVGSVAFANEPAPVTEVPVVSPAPVLTADEQTPAVVDSAAGVVTITGDTASAAPDTAVVVDTDGPGPATVEEAVATGLSLVELAKSKAWPLFAGQIILLLVFILNKFGLKNKVGAKYVPIIAVVIATLSSVGGGLVMKQPILDAVISGLLSGVSAIGSWEVLFKHFASKKTA